MPNHSSTPGQPPQILIDSDWKSQAQAEKERLAEAEAAAEAKRSGAGAAGGGAQRPDFMSLVGMLGTQAVMYLGGVADKRTGQAMFDPEYAAHMIDLLVILEEKTKGNLSAEESSELGAIIQELRARFVELSRLMAAQQARGAGGAGMMGMMPEHPPQR